MAETSLHQLRLAPSPIPEHQQQQHSLVRMASLAAATFLSCVLAATVETDATDECSMGYTEQEDLRVCCSPFKASDWFPEPEQEVTLFSLVSVLNRQPKQIKSRKRGTMLFGIFHSRNVFNLPTTRGCRHTTHLQHLTTYLSRPV